MSESKTVKGVKAGPMHRALLFQSIGERQVQCNVCQRRCKIAPGKTGYCKTRKNVEGQLYSLIYGRVSSMRVSPIEIKPMFHFYPGSQWLSLGSLGCNFLCPGCQNWEIAHADVEKGLGLTPYISPEKAVRIALEKGCKGISWTYNEPTLWFEYTLDSARMAKERGLLTNYVTNGYMRPEALDLLGPHLDTYRVDLKGFSGPVYRSLAKIEYYKGILQIIKRAKYTWGMCIEIITNLIPGINDSEDELGDMAYWIFHHLGPDTPWHLTRFIPHHKFSHLSPTPLSKLERARSIGADAGLKYVYIGNVHGHPAENTHCPGCGELLIERRNYQILKYHLEGNRCRDCNHEIAGFFEP